MNKTLLKMYAIFLNFSFLLISTSIVFGQNNREIIRSESPIPNQYIVVLTDEAFGGIETCPMDSNYSGGDKEGRESPLVAQTVNEFASGFNVRVLSSYGCAIKGFSAEMSEAEALRMLENPKVSYIEEDGEGSADTTQFGAIWGLDRIDKRILPLNSEYHYNSTGAFIHCRLTANLAVAQQLVSMLLEEMALIAMGMEPMLPA
jgi:hypothetical protein